jgi:hypothetical protein
VVGFSSTLWQNTIVDPVRSIHLTDYMTANAYDPATAMPEIDEYYYPWEHIPNITIFFSSVPEDETDKTESPVVKPLTKLHANYPNPFNPSTTISFNNAAAGNVKIDIYNIKGQKVKSLVNDYFSSGLHKVEWNGTDEQQKQVGSGVYFYKMKAENFSDTRKMILMK